jgi:hypothetical protein
MRGNPHSTQFFETRVGVMVQPIAKQIRDMGSAKLSGRQADIMNDQQPNCGGIRSIVKIRRGVEKSATAPAIGTWHQVVC